MNFSIFSMQISAFVLVCGRVLVEVFLFLMAFLFLIICFSTAITALHHSLYEFTSVDKGMETLLEITLGSLSCMSLPWAPKACTLQRITRPCWKSPFGWSYLATIAPDLKKRCLGSR